MKEIQKTIALEGGYSNDAVDPGGETKYGISKRAFPDLDIKNLTPQLAEDIYKREYWDKLFLDSYTFPPFRWKLFDISVNMGLSTATAFNQMLKSKDTIEAVWELTEMQGKRYANIVYQHPERIKYLRGWINRTFELGRELV